MKISLNWIKDFVDIPKKYSAERLGELFTLRTAEVEAINKQSKGFENVVVGEIIEFEKHPHADKLSVAKVNIGRKKSLQVIFGQMVTMKKGDKIPVAIAPTTLPTGVEIQKKELRGVSSEGMLCLDQELGLKEDGISIRYFPDVKAGTSLAAALDLNDTIFEIDNKSLTHRPDLWGHYGIAREFAAITGKKLEPLSLLKTDAHCNGDNKVRVEIKNPQAGPILCRRFLGVIISNITTKESPDWLKKRLQAVDVRPVNNIVDASNYAMLETGHPLHAYDRKKVATDTLIIRTAKEDETIETLDHKLRYLTSQDVVVENGKIILGLAGIMGGLHCEINERTTEIILESANWNPILLRKTSQRLNLRTDASQRFEKDIDPLTHHQGFYRFLELMLKLCPEAKITSPIVDVKNYDFTPTEIALNIKDVYSKIGKRIPREKIVRILKSLEFETHTSPSNQKTLAVKVPSFRAGSDIGNEYDLIEEIARMYGYENIQATLPLLPTRVPEENKERRASHEARLILSKSLGFSETCNYSFYSKRDLQKCLLNENSHLTIQNYLSEDQTHLRLSLLPNLLKNCVTNIKHHPDARLFEFGRIYKKTPASSSLLPTFFPAEEKWLGAIMLMQKEKTPIFYHIKGALQTLLDEFKSPPLKLTASHNPPFYFHPKKTLEIVIKTPENMSAPAHDSLIGYVGELNPMVQMNFDIPGEVGYFELDFGHLVHLGQRETSYIPLPKFPGLDFDVSVAVDKRMTVEEIEQIIKQSQPELIQKIELFDIFSGEALGTDRKSLAFHILLQAPDRTLTDEEMTTVQQTIFNNIKKHGGEIRGKI